MAQDIDLDKLNLDELLVLRDKVDARLSKMAAAEMEVLQEKMAKLEKYTKPSARKAQALQALSPKLDGVSTQTAKRKKVSSQKGKKAPAKFRDPETGNTWSGRGLTPVWLRKYEAKGRKRSDFAV